MSVFSCDFLPSITYCLMKHLLKSVSHFYIGLFVLLSFENFVIYSGSKSFVRYMLCKYFFPVYILSFHPLNSIFCRAKVSIIDKVQIVNFIFIDLCIRFKNSLFSPRPQMIFPLLSSRSFVVLTYIYDLF